MEKTTQSKAASVSASLVNPDQEDTQKDRYLTFRLADEDYGIGIEHVIEIVGLQKISAVPDMPDFVRGVINLRGKVIPVIDVRTRFRMASKDYDERTCVIVVRVDQNEIGLVVDTVSEVTDIAEANVSDPPRVGHGEQVRYIKGIGKVGTDVKILLDVNLLLAEEELAAIGSRA